MPTPYVKKEAAKHDISDEKSDALWEEAKKIVTKEYGAQGHDKKFWEEVMGVYKKMLGEK